MNIIGIIISITIMVFGFIFCFIILLNNYYVSRSNSWSTSEGVIISSELIERKNFLLLILLSLFYPNPLRMISWKPIIKYQYFISGEKYIGKNTDFAYSSMPSYFTTKEEAVEFIGKYQENSKITVYYNPEKLEQSTLELAKVEYFSIIFSLIVVLVGLMGVISSI